LPAEPSKRGPFPRFCRCIAWHSLTYALIIAFSVFFFTGCALPLAAIGSAGTATAGAAGGAIATAAVANPSTAISVASTVTTGKSPLEHAASEATKKECNFLNLLGPKPVCQELVIPPIRDHSQEIIGIADRQTPSTTPIPSR
jgi:hypothetical protein